MQRALTYADCVIALTKDNEAFFMCLLASNNAELQPLLAIKDADGRTLLMRALQYGSINVARVLLRSGLNLHITEATENGYILLSKMISKQPIIHAPSVVKKSPHIYWRTMPISILNPLIYAGSPNPAHGSAA